MSIAQSKKTAVLIVNLGSPASPKTADVRRFLREFLGDPRVVNIPRPIWWMILNLFILPFRPQKSAHAYQTIWTEQGSPLVVFTRDLTAKLADAIADEHLIVDYAMRYGKPSLAAKLRDFEQQGVDEIIVLPLYPQYSSTTTASIFDVVADAIKNWWHVPGLRLISDFYRHPAYIAALADSIRHYWQAHGQSQLLVMSFHGVPAMLTKKGDPYYYHCQATAELLAKALGLEAHQWRLVFQSRFGKAEWLKPYCVEVLEELPQEGIHSVDLVCPGFSVDCLETLEEIAITNQEIFLEAGGQQYRYIPALNDSDAHIAVLREIIQ
jgi:ferrochelatase